MKRIITVLAIVALLAIGSVLVYADNPVTNRFISPGDRDSDLYEERAEWHSKMMETRKEEVNKALEEGIITEEEAKTWQGHFDYMDEFHRENGFISGGLGSCQGRRGHGRRRRHGRGY